MVSERNDVGYGTVQAAEESNVSPIPQKLDTHESFSKRLKLRCISEIAPQRTHLILIGLFFVTGLVDSAAYNIWSCFVSMQTGRLIPSLCPYMLRLAPARTVEHSFRISHVLTDKH